MTECIAKENVHDFGKDSAIISSLQVCCRFHLIMMAITVENCSRTVQFNHMSVVILHDPVLRNKRYHKI